MDYDIVADAAYDASIGPCVPLFGKAFSSKHSQTIVISHFHTIHVHCR